MPDIDISAMGNNDVIANVASRFLPRKTRANLSSVRFNSVKHCPVEYSLFDEIAYLQLLTELYDEAENSVQRRKLVIEIIEFSSSLSLSA